MKIIITSIILVLFSCNSTKKSVEMKEFPSGNYEILEFEAENFKPLRTYTININTEEQRIGGKFDCNSFTCEYEKEGQNIDFGFAISTKMYCDGEMQNEDAFFRNLNKLKSYKYNGDILEFFDEDQNLILKLKKRKS